jgi:hypothetical protein
MATRIRTEPVSLNESTLETNIVSEIAALFNSPFNFGYPHRLRWLFDFDRINFNAFKKRKTKFYRLTPIEENRGGGWDTKIVIPKGERDSRAIFIQFKSGTHSNGNNVNGSIFNLSIKNPNKNAEFTFNDNANNNQHQTLKDLADQLQNNGLPANSVMYAFPRITRLTDFDNLEDDLLLHTSFLTLPEIDIEAKASKVNLYDSQVHNFRTCYIDEKRKEISSDPFQLTGENNAENVLYEIILVKLSHLKNQFSKRIPREFLNEEIFLMLADYLKINPMDTVEFSSIFPSRIIDELRNYYKQVVRQRDENINEIFGSNNFNENIFGWRDRLFKRTVNFFNQSSNRDFSSNLEIPSDYTFTLPIEKPLEIDSQSSFNLLVF